MTAHVGSARSAAPTLIARSETWDLSASTVPLSVIVCSWNREYFLRELFEALEAQTLDPSSFEIVIVDNGSADETSATIAAIAAASPLRMCGMRLEENRGPAGGRNAAATVCRGEILAVTDDDCLPSARWLEELTTPFDDPAVVIVQGKVDPDAASVEIAAPWDHTVRIYGPTPWFETCNVAYRAASFRSVGGFDEDDPLLRPKDKRAFGEDTVLGAKLLESGAGRGFAERAVVHHRLVPSTFRRSIKDQRHVSGMPGLAKRSPVVADALQFGIFLSRATIRYDLALAGAVLAIATRHPAPLVTSLPWARLRWQHARGRTRGDVAQALKVLAEYGIHDAVTLVSLIEGSMRHRRLVL